MQGKEDLIVVPGMIFETNNYGKVAVIEYNSANNVIVEFENGHIQKVHKVQLKNGKLRNRSLPGPSNALKSSEEQINKLKEIHNNFYDYSESEYTTAKDKIKIKCPVHGFFWQTYSCHASGKGCEKCARERTIQGIRNRNGHTVESLIEKFKEIHGDKYEYPNFVRIDSKEKIEIVCKKHNKPFYQVYKVHLKGHGCPDCAFERIAENQRYTTEEFIFLCQEKYGDKYDYSRLEYKSYHEPVEIGCRESGHGFFKTRASSHHYQNTGCPDCNKGGFNANKPATLYVFYSGDMTKVGITNRSAAERCRELNVDAGHCFEVVRQHNFESGFVCSNIETELLRYLRKLYKNPEIKFNGSSECFFDVDREALNKKIEELTND
jgi:hypothetical protein